MKLTVLGAGAWGTALAIHLAKKHNVSLWARDSGHVSGMRKARSNPMYLGDFMFPENLVVDDSLQKATTDTDLILSVVPTSGFREILQKLSNLSLTPIIWANKGLEYETSQLPHEIASQILDNSKIKKKFGVLSGPSFAAELVRDLPTAITCASEDTELSKFVAEIFHHGNMRVYMSNDVIGVSVGGALKNVIAIAAGISDGMGFGNNARAALITRGLAEISRFGMAIGASSETFSGLAGAGDLVLTCTGDYSRNREVGLRLAKGQKLDEVLSGLGHVAEGVNTAIEVNKRSKKLNIDMPITNEVCQVLKDSKSPKDAVLDLLGRAIKTE